MIEESYLESMGREKGILVPRTLKLGLQLQREMVNSSENGKSIGIRFFHMSPNTRKETRARKHLFPVSSDSTKWEK